jgi:hypothetical protein
VRKWRNEIVVSIALTFHGKNTPPIHYFESKTSIIHGVMKTKTRRIFATFFGWYWLAIGCPGTPLEESYKARLSDQDHLNSKGEALIKLLDILRQDRANYHTGKWQDPDDEGDALFTTSQGREIFSQVIEVEIDPALRAEILGGEAHVRVEVAKLAEGGWRLTITRVTGGKKDSGPIPLAGRGAELIRRIVKQCGPGPYQRNSFDRLPNGEEKGFTYAHNPAIPQIAWSSDQKQVTARSPLFARQGAMTHDGGKALFETSPGLLELWDMESNLRIWSLRVTDGDVMSLSRAVATGWMLCVCKDAKLFVSVLLIPTESPHQPKRIWGVSSHPEFAHRNDDLYVTAVTAGDNQGDLLMLASPIGSASTTAESAFESANGLVLFRPEELTAQLLENRDSVENQLISMYPEGRPTQKGHQFHFLEGQNRGFNPLAEWKAGNDESPNIATGLRYAAGVGGKARRTLSLKGDYSMVLDEHNGHWLTADLRFNDERNSWQSAVPRIGITGELRLRKRLGNPIPRVTLQDMAKDGGAMLLRLSNMDRDTAVQLKGYDSWLHGFTPSPSRQSIVLVNLHTLETTIVEDGVGDVFGAFDRDAQLVTGKVEKSGSGTSCRLQLRDYNGNEVGRSSLLTIKESQPCADTFACDRAGEGRWRLSWGDSTQPINYKIGDLMGRSSGEFVISHDGKARLVSGRSSRELLAVASTGARVRAASDPSSFPLLMASDSPDESWFHFSTSARGKDEKTAMLIFGEGSDPRAFLSPSGRHGVVFTDTPYDQPEVLSWGVFNLTTKRQELSVNGFLNDAGRNIGFIGGDGCAWVDDSGFLFFTTTKAAACSRLSTGQWSTQQVSRTGSLANRALPIPDRRGVAVSRDNAVEIWELTSIGAPALVISIFIDESGRATCVTPDQVFAGRARTGSSAYIIRNGEALALEQFDRQLNRPDHVLSLLGAPASIIEAAKGARVERFGDADLPETLKDDNLPRIVLTSKVPAVSAESSLELSFKAIAKTGRLDRVLVWVNGVPTGATDGVKSREPLQEWSGSLKVALSSGRNVIRLCCRDNRGLESASIVREVEFVGTSRHGKLYVAALGVSEYGNPEFNLACAARDARDLSAALTKNSDLWASSEVLCLTDAEVTASTAPAVRAFFTKAKPEDTVVLFAAGHGVLDDQQTYWFATSEFDFSRPGSHGGLAFDQLEGLLAECQATTKLGLMDTCHAGELTAADRHTLEQAAPTLAARGIRTRTFHSNSERSAETGSTATLQALAESFFFGSRSVSGGSFIVSSGGAEFAYESDEWQNGAFTKSVIEALRNPSADTDKDGYIDIGELFDFAERGVIRLTSGLQRPRLRGFNRDNVFPISRVR